MRSARTIAGVAVTLSLLALPGGATAQSSAETTAGDVAATAPAYVTWTGTAVDDYSVPQEPEQPEGGTWEYTGFRAFQDADDPRIKGDHTTVMLGDGPVPPEAEGSGRFTTLVRIENDEGAWQGPVTDVFLPDNVWLQYGWLTGEGAYDGLSFFTSGRFDARSAIHRGEGLIWPGDPPPAPDPALLEPAPQR